MADELALDTGWAIGEAAFAAILADIGEPPRSVVEFGSGPSSIRWALAFPGATVLAVEHDPAWAARVLELHAIRGVRNLRVELRRLRWQWYGLAPYLSYSSSALPQHIDIVIVDGPPGETRRGREACLYQAMRHLRDGGRVYLDDYRRPAERRIGENWRRRYAGAFAARTLDVGHGVLVLEKRADSTARLDAGVWFDATRQAVDWCAKTAPKAALKAALKRIGLRR